MRTQPRPIKEWCWREAADRAVMAVALDFAAGAVGTGADCRLLKRTYPVQLQKQVSHETIYSRHASMKGNGLGRIKNAVSISERPPSIEDRGPRPSSYIAWLFVECHSRYVMLVKVANKDTKSVVSALMKQSQRLPRELFRSLAWDRGKELATISA